MSDLLRKAQLPELSYYQTVGKSVDTPPSKRRDRKGEGQSITNGGVDADV